MNQAEDSDQHSQQHPSEQGGQERRGHTMRKEGAQSDGPSPATSSSTGNSSTTTTHVVSTISMRASSAASVTSSNYSGRPSPTPMMIADMSDGQNGGQAPAAATSGATAATSAAAAAAGAGQPFSSTALAVPRRGRARSPPSTSACTTTAAMSMAVRRPSRIDTSHDHASFLNHTSDVEDDGVDDAEEEEEEDEEAQQQQQQQQQQQEGSQVEQQRHQDDLQRQTNSAGGMAHPATGAGTIGLHARGPCAAMAAAAAAAVAIAPSTRRRGARAGMTDNSSSSTSSSSSRSSGSTRSHGGGPGPRRVAGADAHRHGPDHDKPRDQGELSFGHLSSQEEHDTSQYHIESDAHSAERLTPRDSGLDTDNRPGSATPSQSGGIGTVTRNMHGLNIDATYDGYSSSGLQSPLSSSSASEAGGIGYPIDASSGRAARARERERQHRAQQLQLQQQQGQSRRGRTSKRKATPEPDSEPNLESNEPAERRLSTSSLSSVSSSTSLSHQTPMPFVSGPAPILPLSTLPAPSPRPPLSVSATSDESGTVSACAEADATVLHTRPPPARGAHPRRASSPASTDALGLQRHHLQQEQQQQQQLQQHQQQHDQQANSATSAVAAAASALVASSSTSSRASSTEFSAVTAAEISADLDNLPGACKRLRRSYTESALVVPQRSPDETSRRGFGDDGSGSLSQPTPTSSVGFETPQTNNRVAGRSAVNDWGLSQGANHDSIVRMQNRLPRPQLQTSQSMGSLSTDPAALFGTSSRLPRQAFGHGNNNPSGAAAELDRGARGGRRAITPTIPEHGPVSILQAVQGTSNQTAANVIAAAAAVAGATVAIGASSAAASGGLLSTSVSRSLVDGIAHSRHAPSSSSSLGCSGTETGDAISAAADAAADTSHNTTFGQALSSPTVQLAASMQRSPPPMWSIAESSTNRISLPSTFDIASRASDGSVSRPPPLEPALSSSGNNSSGDAQQPSWRMDGAFSHATPGVGRASLTSARRSFGTSRMNAIAQESIASPIQHSTGRPSGILLGVSPLPAPLDSSGLPSPIATQQQSLAGSGDLRRAASQGLAGRQETGPATEESGPSPTIIGSSHRQPRRFEFDDISGSGIENGDLDDAGSAATAAATIAAAAAVGGSAAATQTAGSSSSSSLATAGRAIDDRDGMQGAARRERRHERRRRQSLARMRRMSAMLADGSHSLALSPHTRAGSRLSMVRSSGDDSGDVVIGGDGAPRSLSFSVAGSDARRRASTGTDLDTSFGMANLRPPATPTLPPTEDSVHDVVFAMDTAAFPAQGDTVPPSCASSASEEDALRALTPAAVVQQRETGVAPQVRPHPHHPHHHQQQQQQLQRQGPANEYSIGTGLRSPEMRMFTFNVSPNVAMNGSQGQAMASTAMPSGLPTNHAGGTSARILPSPPVLESGQQLRTAATLASPLQSIGPGNRSRHSSGSRHRVAPGVSLGGGDSFRGTGRTSPLHWRNFRCIVVGGLYRSIPFVDGAPVVAEPEPLQLQVEDLKIMDGPALPAAAARAGSPEQKKIVLTLRVPREDDRTQTVSFRSGQCFAVRTYPPGLLLSDQPIVPDTSCTAYFVPKAKLTVGKALFDIAVLLENDDDAMTPRAANAAQHQADALLHSTGGGGGGDAPAGPEADPGTDNAASDRDEYGGSPAPVGMPPLVMGRPPPLAFCGAPGGSAIAARTGGAGLGAALPMAWGNMGAPSPLAAASPGSMMRQSLEARAAAARNAAARVRVNHASAGGGTPGGLAGYEGIGSLARLTRNMCVDWQCSAVLTPIFSFLDDDELLGNVAQVCRVWAVSAVRVATTSLCDVRTVRPLRHGHWARIMRRYPWGRFVAEGAVKAVYQVWNNKTDKVEAISVMDVDNLLASSDGSRIVAATSFSRAQHRLSQSTSMEHDNTVAHALVWDARSAGEQEEEEEVKSTDEADTGAGVDGRSDAGTEVSTARPSGAELMIAHELHVSVLASNLVRLNICPNLLEVYSLFQCPYPPLDDVWGTEEQREPRGASPPQRGNAMTVRVPLKRECGDPGRYQFIRMELCDLGDLEEHMRRRQSHLLPYNALPGILFQMCFSLYACRRVYKMRHYDVKLLNFLAKTPQDFLSRGVRHLCYGVAERIYHVDLETCPYVIKLADFGTADVDPLTVGRFVGVDHFTTLENTPVEQLVLGSDAKQCFAADCFALGLSVLHVFTGHAPYEELLADVYCPRYLYERLCALWEPADGNRNSQTARYKVIADVINSVRDGDDEPTNAGSFDADAGDAYANLDQDSPTMSLYHTLYRYVVLFGIPPAEELDQEFVESPVWQVLHQALLGESPPTDPATGGRHSRYSSVESAGELSPIPVARRTRARTASDDIVGDGSSPSPAVGPNGVGADAAATATAGVGVSGVEEQQQQQPYHFSVGDRHPSASQVAQGSSTHETAMHKLGADSDESDTDLDEDADPILDDEEEEDADLFSSMQDGDMVYTQLSDDDNDASAEGSSNARGRRTRAGDDDAHTKEDDGQDMVLEDSCDMPEKFGGRGHGLRLDLEAQPEDADVVAAVVSGTVTGDSDDVLENAGLRQQCAERYHADFNRFSVQFGSDPRIAAARKRLVQSGALYLLSGLVHFNPALRMSLGQALRTDIFAGLMVSDTLTLERDHGAAGRHQLRAGLRQDNPTSVPGMPAFAVGGVARRARSGSFQEGMEGANSDNDNEVGGGDGDGTGRGICSPETNNSDPRSDGGLLTRSATVPSTTSSPSSPPSTASAVSGRATTARVDVSEFMFFKSSRRR